MLLSVGVKADMKLEYDKIKLGLISTLIISVGMVSTAFLGGGFADRGDFLATGVACLLSGIMTFVVWQFCIDTKFETDGIRQWLFLSENFIPWDEVVVEKFSWFRVILKSRKSKTILPLLGSFFWKDKQAVLELCKEKGLLKGLL